MRKTKIVCTLGPATDGEGMLREMMLAGMNVARFNFSHGTHDEHRARLDAVKKLRGELHLPVAAMLDTKGPEVRLRSFEHGSVHLQAGQTFTLTTEDVVGDETRCAISYSELPQDVHAGDTILLDDGLVRLTVLETTAREIRCRVENSGEMKTKKGVNVPGVSLSMPYMSQQDKDDLLFGVEEGFDFVAASFVRCAADVREIRRLLDEIEEEATARSSEYELMIKVKLLTILVLLIRDYDYVSARENYTETSKYAQISRAMKFLDDNISEEFTLEDLAGQANLNRTYFITLFKKLNGVTPWEYITARRVELAKTYLREGRMSILQVATTCGFNNASNFNRAFKKVTGQPPSAYRASKSKSQR
mgnify:CR=1 FL=1